MIANDLSHMPGVFALNPEFAHSSMGDSFYKCREKWELPLLLLPLTSWVLFPQTPNIEAHSIVSAQIILLTLVCACSEPFWANRATRKMSSHKNTHHFLTRFSPSTVSL
uniref:Uncharacterized protein n=1 Tax=Megaselia scalaris TaxID=36166 RepID=T1H4Q1_MEGSC